MNHGAGYSVEDHRGTGGLQRFPPVGTLQAGLPGAMARAEGKLAPRTTGRRWDPETTPAPRADQARLILRGDSFPASEAPPRQEELAEIRRQRSGAQLPWEARRAVRITSREGPLPHHRSNATAPWWRSISEPSAARIPRSRAWSTKGVPPTP